MSSHVHAVGVGGVVGEAGLAELGEAGLLDLDHHLVLDKGRSDFLVKPLGRLGLVLAVAVGGRPEIVARGFGLRRQPVEESELEGEIVRFDAEPASVAPVHCRLR